jgi:hypothetical protein
LSRSVLINAMDTTKKLSIAVRIANEGGIHR